MMLTPKFRRALVVGLFAVAIAGCGRKVDPRVQEGYDLIVEGKLDEGKALVNQILADEPNHAGARNVLGLALYKAGDIEGSIEQYRMALDADPKHPETHFNLGNSLLRLERKNEAEAEFAEAIRWQKDFVLAHYNLASIYSQSGRAEQAIAEYRKAIDYDPQFTFGYVDLGKLLYERRDFEGAITNLSRALELDPSYKQVRVYLGNAYMQSERETALQLAENEYRAAVGIDPAYLDAVYSLGVALAVQNRTDEATEWFTKARALVEDPESAIARQIEAFFQRVAEAEQTAG